MIKTLEYERVRCVLLIKGFDHLTLLRTEFESWCNGRQAHMTLEALRPDNPYCSRKPDKPQRIGGSDLRPRAERVFLSLRRAGTMASRQEKTGTRRQEAGKIAE